MQIQRERNHGLDQLRGICAGSIMIMHLLFHYDFDFSANTYLGRMGYYGVSIFYILSGLTLFKVYHTKIEENLQQVGNFFIKRIFRIYPLLWLVILYYVLRSLLLSNELIDPSRIVLNLSGLFGFVAWDKYIGTGVWSIGNELVFYSLFPFLMYPFRHRIMPVIIYVITFIPFLYFTFYLINNSSSDFWHHYTNPLSQLWYFSSGVFIGKILYNKQLNSRMVYLLGGSGLLLFLIWPTSGEASINVEGMNRIVFSVGSILITVFFNYQSIRITETVQRTLSYLGEISYGIYLLHPIALGIVTLIIRTRENYWLPVGISIILTVILSHLSFVYYEKRFMNCAKTFLKDKPQKKI